MNISVTAPRSQRGFLRWLVIGGFVALVLDLVVWDIGAGGVIPAHVVFGIIYLVLAGLVAATGWRWMPVIAGVVTEIIALMFITYSQGFVPYYLTHPYDKAAFAIAFLHQMLSLLVLVAGMATLGIAREHGAAQRPAWLVPGLSVLGGIMAGGIVISLLAAAPPATSAVAAPEGTVHATLARFSPDIVALHAGDKLTIIPDTGVQHTLLNGTWNDDHPQPGREAGAPLVSNVPLSSNAITIGPFTTPGTYHIYCTIHPGMVLTVVVV